VGNSGVGGSLATARDVNPHSFLRDETRSRVEEIAKDDAMVCSPELGSNIDEHGAFTIGPYTFRPESNSLRKWDRGAGLHLTKTEVILLTVLCRAGVHAVPWQVLREAAWGGRVVVSKHALQTHIYRLRQALEANPKDRRLLITTREGYQLKVVG
jgi:DNA-binding response OmpR family regulator